MAGDDTEQDRTERATPYKLREARKRGQVAKSAELTGTALMLVAVAFLALFGNRLIDAALQFDAALLSQAGQIRLGGHNTQHLLEITALRLISSCGFFIALLIGCALLVNLLQIGPVLSTTPLQPDFKRLNPVEGFKRLFNRRMLFETGKTCLKMGLAGTLLALLLRQRLPALLGLLSGAAQNQPAFLLQQATSLAFALLALLAVIALLDFSHAKWQFQRSMRMSRREIREEMKKREGDPKIKARIRELQREAANRGASLQRVSDADVVITNPTHLSVALRYRQGQMPAPVVIAKGAGDLALKIRLLAARHHIPLVENRALARKLFERVGIDAPIIPETYAQVAGILTAVYRRAGTAGGRPL